MDRRKFMQLAGGAGIVWPLPALAQQAKGLPLLAVLFPTTEDRAIKMVAALRDGLKQAGVVEGTHYALTVRFANGDMPQLPKLAKELDALGPRVFVTAANAAPVVRQQAPNTPLVFTGVAVDVIALGWAESYARPGGMMTGNVQNAIGGEESITTKRIGLFKELMPNLTRLGMIGFAGGSVASLANLEHTGLQKASSRLGFEVLRYDLQWPNLNGLDDAVSLGLRDGVSAFYISGTFVILGRIPEVVASVAKSGRPICGVYPEFARAGCLMSYSIDLEYGFRLTGRQVAKILQGAKPGDLPIEQADKFTLVVNLKTAKALGVKVPDKLVTTADELIE
ncbi:ABC transporter substrate-binding protein [Bradyrhizobium sp. AUGA SZCCT0431]|uniref:ABC transporter substrate-binding protein n=1 Tax=Bradyrhizobium sp. AUGA SZCCT0431 TaxID=2807674 RepID=UPI001BA7A633|nr:ABC transporter substrate-binding protein [Bradyrhizobium sp. AUGA SZCCT0431]MBR1142458.1 ABC transporter substrate-binding protein [Bradyrhizobium sp. AUGA SZCCT0431]